MMKTENGSSKHSLRPWSVLAKENDYSDSSGVYRVVKRLEVRAKVNRKLGRQLHSLRGRLSEVREARRNAGLGRTWRMG